MKIIDTSLPGVLVFEPEVFTDERGFFLETWHLQRYLEAGITLPFVQDNVSFSKKGVLRGLHYQHPQAQGKLVQVLSGEVFDVAVDIRINSPNFGKWMGHNLSCENHRQMYIPPGFAHGFCVLSDTALFAYKCTDFYCHDAEGTVLWNDPDIGIDWPVEKPVVSDKDSTAQPLKDIPSERLPVFESKK